ncbi:MAG TPA: 50S ribosomal protein L22 [Pyrinomonadaceae bacterium]|nr:50S ribosomal protein L22 [Pyrinomonadaceae bacterium]
MEARASAKFLRGSAQKARLVVDMIRGKNVNEALAVLTYTNKRAAQGIEKCVRSAIANATEAAEKANVAVDPDDLWIKACFVDMGPTKNRRRVRPAPQGRAYREQRHFHHVTVLLSNDEREDAKTNARGRKTSPAGKPQTAGKPAKAAKSTAAGETAGTKRAASKKVEQPEETKATAAAEESAATDNAAATAPEATTDQSAE